MTDTRRRVKVYTLNEDRQWDDRGTGHVSYSYVERLKGMTLLVRAEQDSSVLLESKILPDTAYQKQQETLIVWSETDATENESTDLALSFQEKAGCDEIWEQICQVNHFNFNFSSVGLQYYGYSDILQMFYFIYLGSRKRSICKHHARYC